MNLKISIQSLAGSLRTPKPARYFLVVAIVLFMQCSFSCVWAEGARVWTSSQLNSPLFSNYLGLLQANIRFAIPKQESNTPNILRAAIGRPYLNKTSFWLGTDFVLLEGTPFDSSEQRIWEQVSYDVQRNDHHTWFVRSRLEQRFNYKYSGVGLRFRQHIEFRKKRISPHLNLVLSDEVFFNIVRPEWVGTTFFDQNRAYCILEYLFSQNTTFQMGYLNRYINDDSSIENILFASFSYRLD